jgi:UDP-GlcNAc:undecaprenyl-phosphate/decaprenyl-phosphate GlcNAc-1-phosphate transferase
MTNSRWLYPLAFTLSAGITPVVIAAARRWNLMDRPGARKVHDRPIPRLGGVVIFLTMLILLGLSICTGLVKAGQIDLSQTLLVSAAVGIIFATGLFDDLRGLRARTKLFWQVAAAILVCSGGIRLTEIPLTATASIPLGELSWLVTILWLVGMTNALNLIDGLDGLAGGIAALASLAIGIVCSLSGIDYSAVMMLTLSAILAGFLVHNAHPAKIFLGDSGSLVLGFGLAVMTVRCAQVSTTVASLAVPVLALGIPILDTLFSMLRRFIERRSMFAPDCSHFHHRLLAMGLGQRRSALIAWSITAASVAAALTIFLSPAPFGWLIIAVILLGQLLSFRWAGAIRLRDTIDGLRRKYELSRQIRLEQHRLEDIELHFRQAHTFQQWWQAVCLCAHYMQFSQLRLPVTNRNGSVRVLHWNNPMPTATRLGHFTLTVPIRDLRQGSRLDLDVRIEVQNDLESVGRCVTLFARLMEQYRFSGSWYLEHPTYPSPEAELAESMASNDPSPISAGV